MFHQFRFALAASALALSASAASADPYSAVYVFGDSLSDRGNFAEGVGNAFPNPPSYHYSFTNGPTAISLVANNFGLAADPSLWLNGFADTNGLFAPDYVPGTSYAVGGATAQLSSTNGIDGINLPDQLDAYLGHVSGTADPDALYTIFIGGNDIRGATLPGRRRRGGHPGRRGAGTQRASGAQKCRSDEVPRHEHTRRRHDPPILAGEPGPCRSGEHQHAALQQYTGRRRRCFQRERRRERHLLRPLCLNENILANAASYGISNVTDFCYTNAPFDTGTTAACGANAENIDSFAYWNNVHPTRQVHALWADAITASLAARLRPFPSRQLGLDDRRPWRGRIFHAPQTHRHAAIRLNEAD